MVCLVVIYSSIVLNHTDCCIDSVNFAVVLDLHNYARWNGGIVGQGGPTDAQLANVWEQLAKKYR